jgi:hypothetical protein
MAMLIEVLMCLCRGSKKCRCFYNDTYLFSYNRSITSAVVSTGRTLGEKFICMKKQSGTARSRAMVQLSTTERTTVKSATSLLYTQNLLTSYRDRLSSIFSAHDSRESHHGD